MPAFWAGFERPAPPLLRSAPTAMSLFTPSGGLVYHARALRHRSGLWAPFRRAVDEWLAEALPPADELILVGPSAGHCLPLERLARFRRLLVLEPDPVA